MDLNKKPEPTRRLKALYEIPTPSGYESPILGAIYQMVNNIQEQRDNAVVAQINEQIEMDVDKNELIRALNYDRNQFNEGYRKGYRDAKEKCEEKYRWIPITMRPGTDEEYEEFSLCGDCPREDFCVFDSPMPDDEQEVLVTTRWGSVCIDIWHRDVDCCYFENNSDADDVIAWKPLPEPYESEEEE